MNTVKTIYKSLSHHLPRIFEQKQQIVIADLSELNINQQLDCTFVKLQIQIEKKVPDANSTPLTVSLIWLCYILSHAKIRTQNISWTRRKELMVNLSFKFLWRFKRLKNLQQTNELSLLIFRLRDILLMTFIFELTSSLIWVKRHHSIEPRVWESINFTFFSLYPIF